MKKVDNWLFITIVLLAIFGLVMMSSMSIAPSFRIKGENDYFLWRHFLYLILGSGAFILGFKTPIAKIKKLSPLIFVGGIILLLLTFFIGKNHNTFASLWLKIGSFSVQPIEVTKLCTVIFLSAIFASKKNAANTFEGGFVPFAFLFGIPALILVIQSDFGSLLVLSIAAASIYFVAGANLKHFFSGLVTSILGMFIVTLTVPYVKERVLTFLNPENDLQGSGFQIKQSLIAIGSGGSFGRGFQNSIQKFDYLPEVQSDTIFAAISEEMGFIRVIFLVGAFLFIALRGTVIAKNCSDEFSKYLAIGISTLIVGQAFINIGVNLALVPNTGITLPLISYGGSSMIMTLLSAGILLQISAEAAQKKSRRKW
ncbi:putative lipid II flippase FtsW [bacterium DOLZORAL124_38_8]|nr:MAG: putative lipid II flippase FtsW [bacterium DOLZORAL124_38_8]